MEKDFYDFLHHNNIKTVNGNGTKKPVEQTKGRPLSAEEYILPPSKPRQQRVVESSEPPLRSQRPTPRPPFIPQQQKPVMPKPLNEAYSMIESMKKKMEGIFYRYGMIGLERLDEALEDVIEEIMNPQPVYIEREPEPVPVVIEQPKPKRRKPKRKPVVKKVVEEPVNEEQNEEFVDPLLQEDDSPTNAQFAEMAANMDLDALNAVMAKEKKMPKRMTEGEARRNAQMKQLEAVMETQQEETIEETIEESEEDYSNEDITIVDNESEVLNDYEETNEEN